jgi:UDP-4-amino-4,6-dideoxy-N-acetyl-beta-L-altrosamine transaminase
MKDAPFLPYGRQTIEEDDVAAVAAALRGEYLTTGPAVAAFDEAFAAAVGARFALSCNSGTAALHLAAMALGLGPGDAAIVPSITFLATANAARYVGAEVVFADVDPRTGLLGPAEFEAALSRVGALRPCAVFPVHLNGQCAAVTAIRRLAERHGIAVVEDACHALGVRHEDGEPVGSCPHSALAAFSLHPVKAIAMGEGGVVTTNDPALAERVARLRNHGMTRDPSRFQDAGLAFAAGGAAHPWYYEMAEIGFNYRAPDILCALASSQLGKLERFVARRQALAARYDRALGPLAPLVEPVPLVSWSGHAFHLYAVRIDFAAAGTTRDAVMAALRARGIGSQVHYIPVHRQPYYRERYGALSLPGADAYYARCLSLPIFPAMEESDVDRVVDALAASLGHGR